MRKLFLIIFSVLLATSASASGYFAVPTPSFEPEFKSLGGGLYILAPGYSNYSSPGDPSLPFQDIRVIVPPDALPSSITVALTDNKLDTITVEKQIVPTPPIKLALDDSPVLDWGTNKQIDSGRNTLVYLADELFPASHVQLISVNNLRKWKIATVRYFPLRYNPITSTLERTTGGQISLSYSTVIHTNDLSPERLADDMFADKVQCLTANYSDAKSWYTSPKSIRSTTLMQSSSDPCYMIITTSAVTSASNQLQAFASHKANRGFTVEIATEDDWGGGIGDDAANNIRSYLADNYISKQIQYVLLIGNPDPTVGDVPMKMLWPRYYSIDPYREAPSDYFYADLTGNWDLDGDGYYGQQEGDFGPEGVDVFPEVIVGRIPYYGDISEVDSILQKTISYETGAFRGDWVRNVLLSMKPSDSYTPGYHLGEAIKTDAVAPADMHATTVYDSDYGLTPAPDYTPCSFENVISAWQQHAGFHFWWTHGNETTAADVISTDRCQNLDDIHPSFIFQCSCLNGYPERDDNLGFALLKCGAIATNSASRVSWYYPGQTNFANSDSNSGLAYTYATKLIRDHLPCGDAHYATLAEVPNVIWMNHCVFNLYGDPSVQYPSAPTISHSPLGNTDVTTQPYAIRATIASTTPIAPASPKLYWKTSASNAFTEQTLQSLGGGAYAGSIPAQGLNTIVSYYLEATDSVGETTLLPADAPTNVISFEIRADVEPPVITHTPLADTPNKFGPYPVEASITDDLGILSASVHYKINDGPWRHLEMERTSGDIFSALMLGPTASGDTVSYYLTATDISLESRTTRLPDVGAYSFNIGKKIYVGVFNSSETPYYFSGGNSNAWGPVSNILNTDPARRFQVSVITDLDGDNGSIGITGQDVLFLPDNAVPYTCMQTVSDWFEPGKTIVAMDSAASYAAYTGWMWPGAVGTNGYAIIPGLGYWTNDADANDQQIWAADSITKDYTIGQVIGSAAGDAVFYTNKLPTDAHALSGSATKPNICHAAYRDVPGKGRIVVLGPYIQPIESQYSIIRESAVPPTSPRGLQLISPNGGESFAAGAQVKIRFTATGGWIESDRIKIEYCTGLDAVWRQVAGAQSLDYDSESFTWNTANLPGSHGYLVRISTLDEALSDQSDMPFSIVPNIDISSAKSVPDGHLIRLPGKVVICGIDGFTYIEEPDRRAGIRIIGATGLSISTLVNITGCLDTIDRERVVDADSVEVLGPGAQVRPYVMSNRALGGADFGLQSAVMEYRFHQSNQAVPTLGLNNIGLLVRVSGRVVASGVDWFYIDDGSRCDDGSGTIGIKVLCPNSNPPAKGEFVVINAVSSTYFERNGLWRALVLPGSHHLMTLEKSQE